MNIDEILKYKRPKESYYDIIGCVQSSSIEQINKEYKTRALLLHPDKNSDPESLEQFRLLQNAKDVLSNSVTRKSYDTWLNSGINIPFEQWQARKGHSMHWAPPRAAKLSIREGSSPGQDSDLRATYVTQMISYPEDSIGGNKTNETLVILSNFLDMISWNSTPSETPL